MSTTASTSILFNNVAWDQNAFGGNAPGVCRIQCQDVLYIAFREARILLRPQARNSVNELQDGLIFLNQQLDYWSARACYAWTTTFFTFTLTPGHQPHLIGPGLSSPDFAVPGQRPVHIASASLILPGAPSTDLPIAMRDNAWWANQRVKSMTTTVPTDLYYEPDVANGQLWFWGVPTMPYGLRLETLITLQQFQALTDCFIAPQAYLAAITLTLAEELSDIWGTQAPPNLARRAMKARDALQSNNFLPPRIASADWGTFAHPRGDFSWATGTIPNL
jgi:hypothetical protein